MTTAAAAPRRVGVLAVQGGFAPHVARIRRAGDAAVLVRRPEHLDGLDELILPGGESSTQLELLAPAGLEGPLHAFVARGRPVLGTCAGLILAAREVIGPSQRGLGWLDVTVRRNAWGPQLHSFEAVADDGVTPLVFIRAPRITRVGPGVDVLLTYRGEPVMVRTGAVTGVTYHPELSTAAVAPELAAGA